MNYNLRFDLRTRMTRTLRMFSLSLRQLALTLVCLQVVALATFCNTLVGVAVVSILALAIVRLYQIDPEPVLLLLLHVTLSTFILSDLTSTLAAFVIGLAAIHTFGSVELPRDRIIVVTLSLISTTFLGTVPFILCSAIVAAVIGVLRLRPFTCQTVSLFGLFLLGEVLLLDRTLGCGLILVYSALTISVYVIAKVSGRSSPGLDQRRPPDKPFPNGFLPMSSTAESLDLHGYTVTGAMKVIHEYLGQRENEYRYNRSQHMRYATIITGPGPRYSSGEHEHANLIKPTVINFLKINKYRFESSSETPGVIKVDLESHVL